MQKTWNEKDFNSIAAFVNPENTTDMGTGNPRKGKTLNTHAQVYPLNKWF